MMLEKLVMIALGGAFGAVLRYVTTGWAGRWAGEAAAGTMFVNVLGSFLMGVLAVLIFERFGSSAERWAPLILTGVLGGFTTFSAFSLDAYRLFESGRVMAALGYVGASAGFAVLGLVLGVFVARSIGS